MTMGKDEFEQKVVEAMKPNNYAWIRTMMSSQNSTTYMSTGAFLFVLFFHNELNSNWATMGQIIPLLGLAFSMGMGLYIMFTRGAVFQKIMEEKYVDDMQASLVVMKSMMRTHDAQSVIFTCSVLVYVFISMVDAWKQVA